MGKVIDMQTDHFILNPDKNGLTISDKAYNLSFRMKEETAVCQWIKSMMQKAEKSDIDAMLSGMFYAAFTMPFDIELFKVVNQYFETKMPRITKEPSDASEAEDIEAAKEIVKLRKDAGGETEKAEE